MKKDIIKRSDIEVLVRSFYEKVKADPDIGYFFNEVARVNWETHLKLMSEFWENSLLHTGNYGGNPMESHQRLHGTFPLNADLFGRWNYLFDSTVDELYAGENAELLKTRTKNIGAVIQNKILHKNG